MAKLNRESKLREKRAEKQARKAARKLNGPSDFVTAASRPEEFGAEGESVGAQRADDGR
jgi:hypothetical protein